MTHRNEDIVRFLCNYVSPDHQTKEGLTPIHAAVKYQNLEALKILAEAGGNLFALNRNNLSPLHSCTKRGSNLKKFSHTKSIYFQSTHELGNSKLRILKKSIDEPLR